MSFHHSARNIRLDGNKLKAELADVNGKYKDASIKLDKYIGNSDG